MHLRGVPTRSPPLSMSDRNAVFTLPALDMVLWHGVLFRLLYFCSTLRLSASNAEIYVGTSTIQETAYELKPPQLNDVNPAKPYHRNVQTPSCGIIMFICSRTCVFWFCLFGEKLVVLFAPTPPVRPVHNPNDTRTQAGSLPRQFPTSLRLCQC